MNSVTQTDWEEHTARSDWSFSFLTLKKELFLPQAVQGPARGTALLDLANRSDLVRGLNTAVAQATFNHEFNQVHCLPQG